MNAISSSLNSYVDAIERMASTSVFIVGDAILDEYIEGKVSRISPEAPVPVVLESERRYVLGGAGNVAANVTSFGARAFLCSRIGTDADGKILKTLCSEQNIKLELIETAQAITTRKSRVMAGYQQLLRLDREHTESITEAEKASVLQSLKTFLHLSGGKSCVLSDYAKGMLPADLISQIIEMCARANVPVVTDPKSPDLSRYAGTTVLKPDLKEGRQALKRVHPAAHFDDFEKEAEAICEALLKLSGAQNIALSLSEKGLIVTGKSVATTTRLPTRALQVADVCGAGDTMVTFLALGAAAGIDLSLSAEISNIAAGLVCGKLGTATLTKTEIRESLFGSKSDLVSKKILTLADASRVMADCKRAGKKIVFTNGCFDIIHAGHVDYLHKAKQLGDILVVGLNSDASVKRLKGNDRPLQTFDDRAFVLAGLNSVDYVVEFTEDTPLNLILACKPNLLVKGGDYEADTIVGSKEVRSWGGEVHTLSFVEGKSTSRLIQKAQSVKKD